MLPSKEKTICNSLVRYNKIIHRGMSVRQKFSRRSVLRWSVLTAKCSHDEMSLRRIVCMVKCLRKKSHTANGKMS